MSSPELTVVFKRQIFFESVFSKLTLACALLVLVIFVSMIVVLGWGAWPAIHTYGLQFLSSSQWDPVAQEFGALTPIVGTLLTSIIALLIAVPVSFGISIYLTEIAH